MAVIYTEKGHGLHLAIAAAGHTLIESDGDWVSDDDAAVQAIIDGYTLDNARAPIIACIKQIAHEKILAFLPDWKQSNCNARMNELNEARFSRVLTVAELAEVEDMRSLWAGAKAIREGSNAHEAAVLAMVNFESVLAYDYTANWQVE